MTGRNNLLVLGICFLLSAAVHASHDGVNTDFGPGNSGAALDFDFSGTDTQPSCVGDWLSTAASTTGGLDIPEYMDGNPGSITTGISDLMGLGVVIGFGGVPAWDYDSCGEQFIGENP